jgi:hypothetical protein
MTFARGLIILYSVEHPSQGSTVYTHLSHELKTNLERERQIECRSTLQPLAPGTLC